MKKISIIVLMFVAISCSKDKDEVKPAPGGSNTGNNTMITGKDYEATWYLIGGVSTTYENILLNSSGMYVYRHFKNCDSISTINISQPLTFLNDTMFFTNIPQRDWLYTNSDDTLWYGHGAGNQALGYYLKCN